jgi:tRNA A-37 threonylcarbamoyl transferase component Bud32
MSDLEQRLKEADAKVDEIVADMRRTRKRDYARIKKQELKLRKDLKKHGFKEDGFDALLIADISVKQIIPYSRRFDGMDLSYLVNGRVSPRRADTYNIRFDGYSIYHLVKSHISPQVADAYNTRFDGYGISELVKCDVSPKVAETYNVRFDGVEIARLVQGKVSPKLAGRYDSRFNGVEIKELVQAKVSPKQADKYPKTLDGWDIALFVRLGLSCDEIKDYHGKGLLKSLLHASSCVKQDKLSHDLKIIGTGSSSVVLLGNNIAMKFTPQVKQEAILLDKVKKPRYVVKTKGIYGGVHPFNVAIQLEYIHGASLEDQLSGSRPINDKQKIIKYGFDIFRGLKELQRAGIYHRDIRPANIMIDEEKDRAVIIDLGIATKDPEAMPKDNRRYGGVDLMSLGQTIYRMDTGHNLFNEYNKPSLSTADVIAQQRNRFCDNSSARRYYLDKIAKNVKDSRIRDLIQSCLLAGLRLGMQQNMAPDKIRNQAYGEVRRAFERYAK